MCTSSFSVSSVNSCGASVCSTITPIVSFDARQDRHRDHRLEALLLQQREVLHPRVVHRALADELGRAVARHPAGQPLLDRHLHAPDGVGEHRRGGADRQLVVLEQVDEAGVAVGRLGRQVDDALQHRAELERRRHELDDAVQGPVLLAQAVLLGRRSVTPYVRSAHATPRLEEMRAIERPRPGRYTFSR